MVALLKACLLLLLITAAYCLGLRDGKKTKEENSDEVQTAERVE